VALIKIMSDFDKVPVIFLTCKSLWLTVSGKLINVNATYKFKSLLSVRLFKDVKNTVNSNIKNILTI